ncbi:hypothetical protein C8A03DRAFT_38993 [Achaetomium macrosporum]|uniref:Uncharacterized protein n=1 Tax=Achaetomium macrosporum TaxID=79813 RepID=A0AAN7H9X1_9PEZI|nr:hypothetical protein C8A03DRAFT_38993 [Achaetomium macrosporum]
MKPAPNILSAVGRHSIPGTQTWDGSNQFQAPQGAPGRHGRDPTHPTAGGRGGDLHVRLGYDPGRPGFICATGEQNLTGQHWLVSGRQSLLLDCRGGNGGAGGAGENGQVWWRWV